MWVKNMRVQKCQSKIFDIKNVGVKVRILKNKSQKWERKKYESEIRVRNMSQKFQDKMWEWKMC